MEVDSNEGRDREKERDIELKSYYWESIDRENRQTLNETDLCNWREIKRDSGDKDREKNSGNNKQ
jgi:hypothetical protein